MNTQEILISGFGGQGILFAGKFLAYKGLTDDKNVSWLPSYGPEMRGGTASCGIIVSDIQVGSPIVTNPTCLIAMNLPSLERYEGSVVPGGIIIVDSTLVDKKVERDDVTAFYVPATKLAKENGFGSLANMILIGKLLKECPDLDIANCEQTLQKVIPPKKAEMAGINIKAIELGYNF